MITTPNLGLTGWDQRTDPYDHTQLTNNWQAIDGHRHVENGGANQIPTGGIQNLAITTAKIANQAVGTTQIANSAITTAQIANASVTYAKLDPTIPLVPLGACIPWFRPNTSFPVPTNFVIPAGQTLSEVNGDHNWTGAGNVTLPDLTNKFVLGSSTGATGTGPSSPPAMGASGGNNSINLAHSHTVNDHTHPMPDHTHNVSVSLAVASHSHTVNGHAHNVNGHVHGLANHVHAVPAHTHGIWPDGTHNHTYQGGLLVHSRANAFIEGIVVDEANGYTTAANQQSLYVAGFNSGSTDTSAIMDNAGTHSHGSATGATGVNTSGPSSGTTDSGTATTDAQSPGTDVQGGQTISGSFPTDSNGSKNTSIGGALASTQGALGTTDIRPQFVGLLYIMKVKVP